MKTETRSEIVFCAVARKYLNEKIPFCLIRFPNENKTELYFLPDKKAADLEFHLAVAGWDLTKPTYFYQHFQPDYSDILENKKSISSFKKQDETNFDSYQFQFEKYQNAFAKSTLRKAILSRVKNVEIPKEFDPIDYFETLEKAYPAALVYILLHPDEGIWIGATPEILLGYRPDTYQTISLAGTQSRTDRPYRWSPKEIEEQELVSQHIREQLKLLKATDIRESKPETVEAGSVAHLCSVFKFSTENAPDDYLEITNRLHPTPAVAGLPVKSAVEIINKTESHQRRLYTGTIGRKKGDSIDYYVNLRCMQVFPGSVSLYLGGGITEGSTLQSEWDETEKKARTLLNWIEYGE